MKWISKSQSSKNTEQDQTCFRNSRSNLFQKLRKVLTTNHIFFTLKSFEESSSTEKTQVLHSCLIKLEKQVRTCFNNLQLLSKCCTFLFIVSRTFLLLLLLLNHKTQTQLEITTHKTISTGFLSQIPILFLWNTLLRL